MCVSYDSNTYTYRDTVDPAGPFLQLVPWKAKHLKRQENWCLCRNRIWLIVQPLKVTHSFVIIHIYIYIRLKIKPNSVKFRFLSCQIFVLPSTGFEPTPLDTLQHHSLSLTSSALDHSTTSTP